MSTPWEGKLRVRREFIGDDDHQLIPIPEGQKEVADALVHRANAYEGLRAGLEEIAEYTSMESTIARRTLDSLEAS